MFLKEIRLCFQFRKQNRFETFVLSFSVWFALSKVSDDYQSCVNSVSPSPGEHKTLQITVNHFTSVCAWCYTNTYNA